MDANQIFDMISNFGNNPTSILMYAGPVLVFIVFITSVIYLSKKKKNDLDAIDQEIESTPASKEDFPEEPPEEDDPSDEQQQEVIAVASEPAEEKTDEQELAPAAKTIQDIEEIKETSGEKWLTRLKAGLSKSRDQISGSFSKLLTGKVQINDDLLEDIHETLYRADVGVKTADDLIEYVRKSLSSSEAHDADTVKSTLKTRMVEILNEANAEENSPSKGPKVVLVVGVNGVGKTTSIGKLAAHYLAQDKKVLLCAADTFRAAAIDQLKVWGDRLEVDVVAHKQGADPASVAFDGVKAALSRDVDILLIDTAGRLHNKTELMDELSKIKRVIQKDLPDAPHETWIVVDSTTGQNASQQVKAFREVVDLTGIVVTKLDGTAKGGVVIGISHSHKLPIRYIGVGEKAADLRQFSPNEFVEYLV